MQQIGLSPQFAGQSNPREPAFVLKGYPIDLTEARAKVVPQFIHRRGVLPATDRSVREFHVFPMSQIGFVKFLLGCPTENALRSLRPIRLQSTRQKNCTEKRSGDSDVPTICRSKEPSERQRSRA